MTVTRDWYLEINGVPLATFAWEIPNLDPLAFDSPALRGADRPLPYVDGSRAYRRRVAATVLTLPLDVAGDVDEDGALTADPFVGVVEHMDYLNANLGLASATGDGTVPAIFHRGPLDDLAGDVHFLGFKGSQKLGKFLVRTTFDISIPAGRFEVVGS